MSDCCNEFEFTSPQGTFYMDGGIRGKDGVTFYPHVSAAGILSWTNDGGKQNPDPVNIKGADGMSAYAAAQQAGFTGTEAEFNAYLSGIGELSEDVSDLKSAIPTFTNENNTLNLEDYPEYNCTVRASNLLTVSGTSYKSVQIQVYNRFDQITITANAEKPTAVSILKQSLPTPVRNGLNITTYFATGENGRHDIAAGTTSVLNIPADAEFILISVLSNDVSVAPVSVIAHNKIYSAIKDAVTKKLNILVLGNSFSQESFAYLPPVLNAMLPEYAITYGVAYEGSTGFDGHLSMYNNGTAYTWFNYWRAGETKWTRYPNNRALTDIINLEEWDIVYVQGNGNLANVVDNIIIPGHNLLRILQNLMSNTFTFLTGQWLIANADIPAMETAMETIRNRLGVNSIIPIGTGIANARSNTTLNALGDTGNMLADGQHQQAGLPALISTYVIANFLCRQIGEFTRTVYTSEFVPNIDNVKAINAYKTEERPGGAVLSGMTHGDPVGVTDTYIKAAQEIATLAINNPYKVSDCSDILV